jgi:hypothetical protein
VFGGTVGEVVCVVTVGEDIGDWILVGEGARAGGEKGKSFASPSTPIVGSGVGSFSGLDEGLVFTEGD